MKKINKKINNKKNNNNNKKKKMINKSKLIKIKTNLINQQLSKTKYKSIKLFYLIN